MQTWRTRHARVNGSSHFDALPDTRALAITTLEARDLKQIPRLCREMAGHIRVDRDARVMVMGIPNVGKSTPINGLAGRKIAKTGNEPAVTKRQQKIRIDGGIALIDTPGVMWPKIEDQASAYFWPAAARFGIPPSTTPMWRWSWRRSWPGAIPMS